MHDRMVQGEESFAGIPAWVMSEYRGDLGDARLNARLLAIAGRLSDLPGGTPSEVFQVPAEKKAFYRFVENDRVDPERILAGHTEATLSRLRDARVVLAIQDTTSLNFTRRKSTEGLGLIGDGVGQGLLVHTCLAVGSDGVPLGLLSQDVFWRSTKRQLSEKERYRLPFEEKESVRWRDTLSRVANLDTGSTLVVSVMDREGDIYDVFRASQELESPVLIRSCYSRRLAGDSVQYLWDEEERALLAGALAVKLQRRPDREERVAQLEVRFAHVSVKPPEHRRKEATYSATIVFARERQPPEGEEPVHWRLVTTVPVASLDDAREVIRWYALRWQIERFHFTLKSGCGIERLQLEHADNIRRTLSILSIQAQRLLYLVHESRAQPNAPASLLFSPKEILALRAARVLKLPERIPLTARAALRAVAQLGGFNGRKGDGDPGVKTVWRGLRILEARVLGLEDALEMMMREGRSGQW